VGVSRFLLDTHALLWWLFDDPRLRHGPRALIADPSHQILVSSASVWEIATKHRIGRLGGVEPLLADVHDWLRRAGFEALSITIEHAQMAGTWPVPHRDPFDRMLAAQSKLEGIPLISSDAAFVAFGVQLRW
jgi:PIN domain nuclease of toxin-antitoxin system